MSYVNPKHSMFRNWPTAHGPGMHADESDSALPDIGSKLPTGVANDLSKQSDASWGRANPAEEPIGKQQDISEAAMWITGMWGPGPSSEHSKKFLPIVRENPVKIRPGHRSETFFDRMRICFDLLSKLRDSASAAYDKRGAKKRDWQESFEDCLAAVEFVLSQEHAKDRSILSSTSRIDSSGGVVGVLGTKRWGVIAVKGNDKLPFAAYSEFPMATCIGAGACRNYCYSFKALRYPAAFRRLFLNTLANYADREFAIMKASGRVVPPSEYEKRVQFALQGSQEQGYRIWPGIVKSLVLASTAGTRANAPAYLRLFVDGDINYEDNIVEWMQVCHDMDVNGEDVRGTGLHHVEVYGYSKCWNQFVNVDSYLRNESQAKYHKNGGWPKNYTVNMSDASVYAAEAFKGIRNAMMELPVSRGYFKVVDLKGYIKELSEACREFGGCMSPKLDEIIEKRAGSFPIDMRRVRTLAAINDARTAADVVSLFPDLADAAKKIEASIRRAKTPAKATEAQNKLIKLAMHFYIDKLINDETWGMSKIIRDEIAKDNGATATDISDATRSQEEFLEAQAEKQVDSLEKIAAKGPSHKTLADKAVALALHETYWALGIGGSCPLVCGNCSDNPSDPKAGAHRCASKTGREHSTGLFWHKTIHIGLHILPFLFVPALIVRSFIA